MSGLAFLPSDLDRREMQIWIHLYAGRDQAAEFPSVAHAVE